MGGSRRRTGGARGVEGGPDAPGIEAVAALPVLEGIKDPLAREIQALLRPEVRATEGRYLLEGDEMVEQALREAPSPLDAVVLADAPGRPISPTLSHALAARGVPAYRVSRGLLFKLLGTSYETATTSLAVARRAPFDPAVIPPAAEGRILLAGERIQDPRNVGVMVRTADAVGAPAFLLSAGSADPWSRQAVRSSTGSILRLPVSVEPDLLDAIERIRGMGYTLVATSAAAPRTLWDAELAGPVCCLLGNETEGLSPAIRDAADLYLGIPLLGGAHSLNVTVACGIVLYEALRQRSGRGGA